MESNNTSNTTIHLIGTSATILNTENSECGACYGVAAVSAWARNVVSESPVIVLPLLDRYTQFVEMHPLKLSVNTHVFNVLLGWGVFLSKASLLSLDATQSGIRSLQSRSMPLLLTNAIVSPISSWHEYSRAVHLDAETKLAVLSIVPASAEPSSRVDSISSVLGILRYVAKLSRESGCNPSTSLYDSYLDRSHVAMEAPSCWIPVVWYCDPDPAHFEFFLQTVTESEYAPAAIVDTESNSAGFLSPRQYGSKGTWVLSYKADPQLFTLHSFVLDEDRKTILNFTTQNENILDLPENFKDEIYLKHVTDLEDLAAQAIANNPILGNSTSMPAPVEGDFYRCIVGECELGNLFSDALRWYTGADVAFLAGDGFRGSGWPEGFVRVSDLWEASRFPYTECTGTMSGISLFQLLNYSTSSASLNGFNIDGGEFLQTSGMRVTYNPQLSGSRLIAIEVWDQNIARYEPLERLRMYRFATDSNLCQKKNPFPNFLGPNFAVEGEIQGAVGDESQQNIVGQYLAQLDLPYEASLFNRLRNNVSSLETLNLVQVAEECPTGTYWITERQTCFDCPDSTRVAFSEKEFQYQIPHSMNVPLESRVLLLNEAPFAVSVGPSSIPSWVSFTRFYLNSTIPIDPPSNGKRAVLQSGGSLTIDFTVRSRGLSSGTALGTVSFGVHVGGAYPGCDGQETTFDILIRVAPPLELNQLGNIRYIGLGLSAIILLTAAGFALWVRRSRETRIVKTMQPLFLVTICCGVFVLGAVLVPLSIDDEIVSNQGCDIACISMPWLASIGFTVTFSALFSKLWRINKLFQCQHFRRTKVEEKDVLAPFAVLFTLNLTILVSWTVVDPLKWSRAPVNGEFWNTHGECSGSSKTTTTLFLVLICLVNAGAFSLACWQAYRARKISDEFSESKNLGMAIFCWAQLLAVGCPVLFLINSNDPVARFFLLAVILFATCMSMLMFIFVPLTLQSWRDKRDGGRRRSSVQISGVMSAGISGVSLVSRSHSLSEKKASSQETKSSNMSGVTAPGPSAILCNNRILKDDLEIDEEAVSNHNSFSQRASVGDDNASIDESACSKKLRLADSVIPAVVQEASIKSDASKSFDVQESLLLSEKKLRFAPGM
jgi:hypothetical protein